MKRWWRRKMRSTVSCAFGGHGSCDGVAATRFDLHTPDQFCECRCHDPVTDVDWDRFTFFVNSAGEKR